MKYNKIAAAIITTLLLPSISSADVVYKSIVHKNDYKIKEATLIPGKETGINVVAKNTTTNQSTSSDITKNEMSLNAENGEFIELTSNILDNNTDGRSLVGNWTSSRALTFLSNNKNEAIFQAPNYDGVYYISLNLNDGQYSEQYRSLKVTSEFWQGALPLYSEWSVFNIDQDWSPDLSLSYENESITQTKITDLSRTKQEREKRPATGAFRNIGSETTELQNNVQETRSEYGTIEYWTSTDSVILNDWSFGEVLVDWNPISSDKFENETISQTREIENERTMQDKEIRPKTNAIRNDGAPYLETTPLIENRDVQGDLEYWITTDSVIVNDWGFGEVLVNWNPSATAKFENETISQTREIQNERTMQDKEIRPLTSDIRNDGVEYIETTPLIENRNVQGDLEYWIATDTVTINDWGFGEVLVDWNPSAATVYETGNVNQSREIQNERTLQDKEIRPLTGVIRNDGAQYIETSPLTENRTIQGQLEYWIATSPKVITDWNVTQVFVDWTPDASGVYENDTVSQYREIKKERSIQDQEIRPINNQLRTISATYADTSLLNEYRDVQGQLEFWENSGISSCTNWSLDRYDIWLPDASGFEKTADVVQTRTKYEERSCTGEQVRPATGATRNAESETEYRTETQTQTVTGTKIDLNNWGNTDGNGTWSVSNDGSYAYQSINGNSTVFESAASSYGNTVIKGKMNVRAGAGDDDFIGIVLGKTDANNFLLWSWKRATQAISGGSSKEGHTLAKVTGGISSVGWLMDLNSSGYTLLDSLINDTSGWEHGTYYDFEITYTSSQVIIKLDGVTILSANGSFDTGKIGFFNLSQGQVEYYKVSETPIN